MTTAAAPAKRKRGRPKTDHSIPIYDLPGPTSQERLHQIYDGWFNCQRCELAKVRCDKGKEDIVFGDGNAEADILIVGEAPGEDEEKTLIPFTGPSGKLLNKILANVSGDSEIIHLAEVAARHNRTADNVKLHEAVEEWRRQEMFITNAVACRPPDNATPTPSALKACWERLWNTILVVDPLFIFAVGKTPTITLLKKSVEITKVRGTVFDVTHEGRAGPVTYPVMSVLHPSYLLRKADWNLPDGDWRKTVEDWRSGLRAVDFLRQQHYGTSLPNR
jgi:uracil-DNA glycosylase family 4